MSTGQVGTGTESTRETTDKSTEFLIHSSKGLGFFSIEAMSLENGLVVWAHDLRPELGDVTGGAGIVYVSTYRNVRRDPHQAARITALQACDGSLLWQVDSARFRGGCGDSGGDMA